MEKERVGKKVSIFLAATILLVILVTITSTHDLALKAPRLLSSTTAVTSISTSSIPISSLPAVINNPGYYYLTDNLYLNQTGADGIEVLVDDVTIDLMGYCLTGPATGDSNGISIDGVRNVEILNGTIRDWGGNGICDLQYGESHRIHGIRALHNGASGIDLYAYNNIVRDCTAGYNESTGIGVGEGSIVDRNEVYMNFWGIYTGTKCRIVNNVSEYNSASGIAVGSGCTVLNNTSTDNGTELFFGVGVLISDGASGCMIKQNNLCDNLDYGIVVYGMYNTLEENLATGSLYGIYFDIADNFYANNRCLNNNQNYDGTTGQHDGGGNVGF